MKKRRFWNRHWLLRIKWLLVIAWMVFIFLLSNQNDQQSSALSGAVIESGARLLVPSYDEMSTFQKQQLIQSLQHFVRKTAHFVMYLCLGILVITALHHMSIPVRYKVLIALMINLLYAIFDEVHQHFIPGRGPGVMDVVIDFMGALTGILLFHLVHNVISWRKRGRKIPGKYKK